MKTRKFQILISTIIWSFVVYFSIKFFDKHEIEKSKRHDESVIREQKYRQEKLKAIHKEMEYIRLREEAKFMTGF